MVLLDSNIIIYLFSEKMPQLAERVATVKVAYTWIVKAETLGWRSLDKATEQCMRRFFAVAELLTASELVYERAIELRKEYHIQLPDSLIAAAALEYKAELWTANTEDFSKINGLCLHNPLLD